MKYSEELHKILDLFVKLNEENNPEDRLATVEETHALLDEIDRLQAERRWIPVKTNTIYQSNVIREVITEEKKIYLAFLCTEGWVDPYRNVIIDNVTHYMPLPEPPDAS